MLTHHIYAHAPTHLLMPDKTTVHIVPEPLKSELTDACYPIIGAIFEAYKTLGPGLPEYIYQEALMTELTNTGLPIHKEQEYHPVYKGQPLQSYLKMDFVVETTVGNIIIECKALTQLTEKERYQTFGYLRGTGYPVALLVNFGTSPKVQLERFYNNNGSIEVF